MFVFKVTEKKPVVAKAKDVSTGGGEAKASCPICFKTFRRLFNMRTHVNRVHEKVKPFACSVCEKSFATNSDLKQHMVVHGEGKMFPCEICGRELVFILPVVFFYFTFSFLFSFSFFLSRFLHFISLFLSLWNNEVNKNYAYNLL